MPKLPGLQSRHTQCPGADASPPLCRSVTGSQNNATLYSQCFKESLCRNSSSFLCFSEGYPHRHPGIKTQVLWGLGEGTERQKLAILKIVPLRHCLRHSYKTLSAPAGSSPPFNNLFSVRFGSFLFALTVLNAEERSPSSQTVPLPPEALHPQGKGIQ